MLKWCIQGIKSNAGNQLGILKQKNDTKTILNTSFVIETIYMLPFPSKNIHKYLHSKTI